MNPRFLYVRQRAANATRMLRKGEFRKIGFVIYAELRHRFRKVPPTAYNDGTRVIPPSPRPTKTRLASPPAMKADGQRIGEEIRNLLSTIDIDRNRDKAGEL